MSTTNFKRDDKVVSFKRDNGDSRGANFKRGKKSQTEDMNQKIEIKNLKLGKLDSDYESTETEEK